MYDLFGVCQLVIEIINERKTISDLTRVYPFKNYITPSYVIKKNKKISIQVLKYLDGKIAINYFNDNNVIVLLVMRILLKDEDEERMIVDKLCDYYGLKKEKIKSDNFVIRFELKNQISEQINFILIVPIDPILIEVRPESELIIQNKKSYGIKICLVRY
jgi:hypothetical protein